MSTQTLFEVHTLKSGEWQVDSTYHKREEAIECARGLFGEKIFQGVKVIQDKYDEQSGGNREVVIYDSNKKIKSRTAPATKTEDAPTKEPRSAMRMPTKSGGRKDASVAVKASLLLVVILGGGLGLLYGLDYVTAWFSRLF